MDRKTRRANFKNLQLRSARSTKASIDTPHFIDIPEDSPSSPSVIPPESDTPERKIKPIRNSNVFEKPGPKPKKAPKLKGSSASSTTGSRRGRGKNNQPSISNFLKNEQIFAEVTAQHCMADNFSPDDIEMALALSKSEAEAKKRGCLRLNDEKDAVVDLIDDKVVSTENIRLKLQKYGFRTAAKEDYNSLAVLPVLAGKGGRRGKWANKFTALTLRNPIVQQKKLEEKVSALLAQQVRTKTLKDEDSLVPTYTVISASLQQIKAESGFKILREPDEGEIENLNLYYVKDLIQVSQAPAHHLLKNWAAIQGRDLSPERETPKSRQLKQQLERVYVELENHFGDQQKLEEQVDELENLVAENMIEDDSKIGDNVKEATSSTSSSPCKEPPDKRPKTDMDDKENQKLQPTTSNLSVPIQITRCISPDLFADSDDEQDMSTSAISNEPTNVKELSLKVYKNVSIYSSSESPTQITTFEVFSSDEVKTVTNATQGKISFEDKPIDDFIDLTQDFENSIFSEQSPKITSPVKPSASDSNVDILFGDVDINFSSEKSSFHLDIITTPNDTKRSSSFNDINFSENSIRRSNSVSTDYSFKSPLNFKMNLSADKLLLPVASPYAHSEASIDLTQNSNDESDVILLSDEEINYSIWKSNKTAKALDIENESSDSSFSSPVTKKRAVPQFRTESDLDDFLKAFSNDGNRSKSSNSPNKCSLSKDRAEFGILDAEPSQPLSSFELQSPIENSDINWAEASFLDPPIKPLARRSSHKFNDLLAKISKPESNSDLDYDEFDQMVFQNTKSASVSAETNDLPSGLDLLLRGEIKTTALPEPCAPKDQPQIVPDQVEIDGKVYSVGVCHTPKPDFATLSESEILKQLYEYGIKPLKRKQAVKLLEFIYNQTHPIMQAAHIRDLPPRSELIARSKSTPVMMEKPLSKLLKFTTEDSLTPTESKTEFKFNDASGEELLRFSQTIPPMLCNDFETFVMQTNVSKKTPQPLVPLHIAWHNLLCANPQLHESVLMFEPIDLQEVYLYLKHLGHRYDPKDLKSFFDQRCIIFRYELAAPGKQSERHVRKQPKKTSKRN